LKARVTSLTWRVAPLGCGAFQLTNSKIQNLT